MAPLGYTRKGKAVWPVSGGAPEPGEQGSGSGQTPPATPPPAATPPAGRTFTQAEVDDIVRERAIAETRRKFGDYDDLKAKAQQFDALQAENATTLERERTKAKAEGASEVLSKANRLLIAAEVRALAAAAKFRDPHDALAHLTVTGGLEGVKVSPDGVVDSNAVKAALDTLAKDKAYLLESTEPPPPPPPPASPGAAGVGTGSAGNKREVQPGMDRLRTAYSTPAKT
jgi:hypothetical protein